MAIRPPHYCGTGPRAAALTLALLLAGCAAAPPGGLEIPFRNPTAPLGGISRFDAARFAGEWRSAACIGPCRASVRYKVRPDGTIIREAGGTRTPYRVSAPGILRAAEGTETLVVMWVDEGYRTAAVGDAEGRWAAILDRGRISTDRLSAAREMLDFNGWDVSRLTTSGS